MSRLDTIIEQTVFLIEKQKEAQRDCSLFFHDLLQTAQKKCDATAIGHEDREGMEYVCDLISEQAERISEDAQIEIDYLEEQLEALQSIKSLKDPKREEEMLGELLDAEAEVKDTKEFIKEVTDESLNARHNLAIVINDMKAALSEGNVDELVTYLETILEADEEEGEECENCEDCKGCEDFDDEEEGEEEEECCCTSKKKPAQSSCCGNKNKSNCCK